MLIDATYEGEKRIVVLEKGNVQELHYEFDQHEPIVGNIYLGTVERVEPGLEAAFVDYGAKRHGFLSLRQVHKSYLRSPKDKKPNGKGHGSGLDLFDKESATRSTELIAGSTRMSEALLDLRDYISDFSETGKANPELFKHRRKEQPAEKPGRQGRGGKASKQSGPNEVLNPGQLVLVQITKDEVNEKGAALTTYISLPGRYCVLLPLSDKGCEISKKIIDKQTRARLEAIYGMLDVPEGAGVIMRSVLSVPDKKKIRSDFDSLMKQWAVIRDRALKANDPRLIHSEGNIIRRTLRDLDTQQISKIVVDGKNGYEEACEAITAMMPEAIGKLERYQGNRPLFVESDVERQLIKLQSPRIDLKSGAQIVIEQTEAMVTIDVNSAKACKGATVEDTAVKTNVEAAVEIARQLRLRDLAGIIVIDFIDMFEQKHRYEVKRTLKREMARDRAKISMEDISSLGLLEMSRQRLRKSVISVMTDSCTHCSGSGRVARPNLLALTILRQIEGECSKQKIGFVKANVPVILGNTLLNEQRGNLTAIEQRHDCRITIECISELSADGYEILTYRKEGGKVLRKINADTLLGETRPRKSSRGKDNKETTSSVNPEDMTGSQNGSLPAPRPDAARQGSASGNKGGRRKYRGRGKGQSRKRKSVSKLNADIRSGAIEVEMGDLLTEENVPAGDAAPLTNNNSQTGRTSRTGGRNAVQSGGKQDSNLHETTARCISPESLATHPVTDLMEFRTLLQN